MKRIPAPILIVTLAIAAAAAVAASIAFGSSGIDAPWERFSAGDPLVRTIVLELRLPRALAAFGAGVVLALAGVLMQALLRNPLADPYVLGVSGGAAVGALSVMLAGLAGIAVDAGAAIGAFSAMLLVFAVAHGPGGWTTTRLLLTGVV
jgi:iron complex transport system permease protein